MLLNHTELELVASTDLLELTNNTMLIPVQLSCESYVCDARPHYPLLITAKRYFWDANTSAAQPPPLPEQPGRRDEALTLICAHGVGFHKEQWEPTIQHILERDARAAEEQGGKRRRTVREIWSIDSPNHGDGAVLNEETLKWGYASACT